MPATQYSLFIKDADYPEVVQGFYCVAIDIQKPCHQHTNSSIVFMHSHNDVPSVTVDHSHALSCLQLALASPP